MAFYPTLNTPTTGYTVQPGCGFMDPAYYAATKAVHNAIDLNAVSGGNSDLGDPVHAADAGVVTNTGWDGYIGGMLEIRHADGSTSGYWHLRDIHVLRGQTVGAGDLVGQIGKGGPRSGMFAHLHFYVKKPGVPLPLAYWPSTQFKGRAECEAFVRANYEDPLKWLKARGAKKNLSDLQALRGGPAQTLVNGADVTGTLVSYPAQGVTVDARTSRTVVYLNGLTPAHIPPTPQ